MCYIVTASILVFPRQQHCCVVSFVASGSWLSTRRWISLKPNLAEDCSLLESAVPEVTTRRSSVPQPSSHPTAICSQPTTNIFFFLCLFALFLFVMTLKTQMAHLHVVFPYLKMSGLVFFFFFNKRRILNATLCV